MCHCSLSNFWAILLYILSANDLNGIFTLYTVFQILFLLTEYNNNNNNNDKGYDYWWLMMDDDNNNSNVKFFYCFYSFTNENIPIFKFRLFIFARMIVFLYRKSLCLLNTTQLPILRVSFFARWHKDVLA